jgi:integrase
MATGRITKRSVDALTPRTGDTFLWDDELRGFGVKVTPTGRKGYIYQYRMGGRGTPTKRWTIGPHGSPWTAVTARTEAERLALLVGQGVDPVEDDKQRKRSAATLEFSGYLDTFRDGYLKTEWGDSWPQAYRQLEVHALPLLKGTAITAIGKPEINSIFDRLKDRPGLSRNVWAALSKLLNWAARRGDIPVNVMVSMDPPPPVKSRKRVLSDDEVVALWRATMRLTDPFGQFVRLLLLTLQRRSEVADLPWKELNKAESLWRLPGERAKNGVDHLVPLSTSAVTELTALKWQTRGYVFTTTGTTAISGFSRMKARLDRLMAEEMAKLAGERADPAPVTIEPWRLHDLRRTGTTRMQRLGFPIEVTERVINHHQGGEAAGIRGIYNLYEYQDEKTRALQAWADWLSQLVDGAAMPQNVVALASRRA